MFGFKNLHYSITESSGTVDITIVNKCNSKVNLGYRTIAGTATSPKDYDHTDC